MLDCEKLHEMIEDWFGVIPCSEEGINVVGRKLAESLHKEMYIKEEVTNFIPQSYADIVDGDGVVVDQAWPAKDVKGCFEEIRFILKYGMPMGKVGSIPGDWETNPESATEIQSRVDAMWEEDDEEDDEDES